MRTHGEQAAYLDGMNHGIRVAQHKTQDQALAIVNMLFDSSDPEVKHILMHPTDPTRKPWKP